MDDRELMQQAVEKLEFFAHMIRWGLLAGP